jgi:nucleotide-binding universal stress UspA family protein
MVMTYKDILVYLDPTEAARDRLLLAIAIAQAHGARLTGVDASSEAALGGAWGDVASRIGPEFEAAVKQAGLVGRFVEASAASAIGGEYGHCVDLIIAPRPEGEARALVRSEIPDGTLLASGAPMLILPDYWKLSPVGENIVIAWNASREAIRAVHDAMPLLVKAKKVTIFTFSARESGLQATSEMLSDHLLRHGVVAKISDWTDTGEMSALEGLFANLDTQNADLIVAGAFGHSRLFESLFGGVSLDMMRQPTAPLFLAH